VDTHLEIASQDQFRAPDLMRLTSVLLLITRTPTAFAVYPRNILGPAVHSSRRTVRR
jgi:hypothetical protein